jgi:NAD(P)-dependent dehydrogenase (short-subunit alcohol dehydrogenase family)
MESKTILVTGGTDGIGKAIAGALAAKGAEVIIVGSNPEKGVRANRELRLATGNDRVHFVQADLSLVQEAGRLAGLVTAQFRKLDQLILCAGIFRAQRSETAEGIESHFAVNYLSRFALTGPLLPRLAASGKPGAASRILLISGGGVKDGKIHYEDINLRRNFSVMRTVLQVCGANDTFVIEQARRLAAPDGQPRVTINLLGVGVVRTNIRRGFPLWMKVLVPLVLSPLLGQTPDQIAESALSLLTAPEFEGVTGALFKHFDRLRPGVRTPEGIRRFERVTPGKRTADPGEGRRLWELSEELAAQAQHIAQPAR